MLSPTTFPSRVENAGLPRAYYGGATVPQYNTYVGNTPFHREQMEDARKRVLDRARINAKNIANYGIGGTRNILPKPQPQGSFFRPLTTSGNQIYQMNSAMRGTGGTFRTREGQQYGINLLQKRARQLEELALAREEGMPVTSIERKPQPQPLGQESEDKVAFDLLLGEINTFVATGQYSKINTADVRKAFGILRKIIYDLTLGELKEYYELTSDILDILDEAFEEDGLDVVNRVIYDGLRRLNALLRIGIASINKSPRERKTFVNQFIRLITRATGENFEFVIDTELKRLQDIPNFVEPTVDRDELPPRPMPVPRIVFGDEELEGEGAWNCGQSRMMTLYGQGLNVDEDGEGMANDGMNDQRFSNKRQDTQTKLILGKRVFNSW